MSRANYVSVVVLPPLRHRDACVTITIYGPDIARPRRYQRRVTSPSLHRLSTVIWARAYNGRASVMPSMIYTGWNAYLGTEGG